MDNNSLIQQARELCEKATPGPWTWGGIKEDSQYDFKASSLFNDRQLVIELDDVYQGYPECGQDLVMQIEKADAAFIAASRTLVQQLCDALEAAEKENEGLKNILQFNMVQIHGERMTVLDALSSLTARSEKAEAEIKSIHESLNFADKSRSKCANYVELAVSNGLALGRIAVAIQHDYDAEPPKGV